jgi:hypothetical protein
MVDVESKTLDDDLTKIVCDLCDLNLKSEDKDDGDLFLQQTIAFSLTYVSLAEYEHRTEDSTVKQRLKTQVGKSSSAFNRIVMFFSTIFKKQLLILNHFF